ncbi:TonB-dependent vitamin B12 receptor [Pseudoxanthomonas sp. X-1]|uniref:TonB-dependent vitamin B12 receptor n=1 Tax=Pseudoxanthomonas sp. X-1 TaxID=2571115 RepID=UPI00110B418E|nr:TonB-dependent vitamin B12 receptor [Pseudoxanthomonas sp. X-1]TMN19364.1 TonB-dependent vitamin B12 receptor [Pseudoxanthomonas sp. X-1]UAY75371.1 TonB-dependent vitamin B12 receptor [Pseudoxanthomonas sp. X-1]
MKTTLLSLAIGLGLSATAAARPADDATDLDQVSVTATRTEVAVQDSLVPVQVISREEIERSQATSLPELLAGRAGVNIANQGGPGKLTSVFLRGSESDHVLVLVDGVRIGSVTAGLAAFQDLPVSQIERIEIVRGPRSSLYGSEAIGGVIQIFTRGGGKGLTTYAQAGFGSHGLRDHSAGFSYRGERGWLSANGGYQDTDGINACRGTAGDAAHPFGAGCYADEPDRDGYRNTSFGLRAGIDVTDTLALEGNFLNADSYNEYDGTLFGGNEAKSLQRVAGGKLRWNPNEAFQLTVQAGRNDDEADNYFADADTGTRSFVSTFDTRRDTASAQGDYRFAEGQTFTLGVDWLNDRVTSTTPYDIDARDNTGVFAEYQGSFGAHALQASVRNDDNEQFGSHTTGSLGYGFGFGNGFKFTANAGTGFKAPNFNDLYYPGFSNPDLKPEKSKSLNLGLAQYGQGWNWTFNAYETRIDDLIGYDTAFNVVNVDKARIRGAELTGFVTLAGLDINAQLSHADARDDGDGANHDKWLARRARDTARLDLDYAIGDFRLGLTGNAAGKRYDDAANTQRLGGYGTMDVRLEYALSRDWTLLAKAANVFDKDYETVQWYNQPGREYTVSVRWQARQ